MGHCIHISGAFWGAAGGISTRLQFWLKVDLVVTGQRCSQDIYWNVDVGGWTPCLCLFLLRVINLKLFEKKVAKDAAEENNSCLFLGIDILRGRYWELSLSNVDGKCQNFEHFLKLNFVVAD